jgi:LysM repeat protein
MNDWIHRVNILEPRWDEIGVGAAQASNGYWILVTDFGNIDGGALPPVVESAPVTQLTAAADISVEALPADGSYSIQSGDTLLGIAIRFGLDWQDIALANDMSENDLLQIGDVIRLPMLNGGAAVVNTGGVVAGKKTHSVRTGETLWTISARYQVAWQDIAAVNGLGEYDLLQIGQELKLPASLDDPEEEAAPESSVAAASDSEEDNEEDNEAGDAAVKGEQAAAPVAASVDASDEGPRFAQKNAAPATYTVKSGDTLLAIAINQDVSWQELADVNGLEEDTFLQIGQELILPGAGGTVQIAVAGSGSEAASQINNQVARTHSVKAGDTAYGIALQYDVDWEELLRLNNLQEDSLLQLGQELQLP